MMQIQLGARVTVDDMQHVVIALDDAGSVKLRNEGSGITSWHLLSELITTPGVTVSNESPEVDALDLVRNCVRMPPTPSSSSRNGSRR
jgi:hypothetical protein